MFLLELQLSQNKVQNSHKLGKQKNNMTKKEKIDQRNKWQDKRFDQNVMQSKKCDIIYTWFYFNMNFNEKSLLYN